MSDIRKKSMFRSCLTIILLLQFFILRFVIRVIFIVELYSSILWYQFSSILDVWWINLFDIYIDIIWLYRPDNPFSTMNQSKNINISL